MKSNKNSLIEYFNYDLEKALDEFNNYYVLKSPKIPLNIQVLYLYFSHLAENSLAFLINYNYNIKSAVDIINMPIIYIKPLSEVEIYNFLQKYQINPRHFYGLVGFSLYFFEFFLQYIKYNNDKYLFELYKNIPIIEDNLKLIRKFL